jgi:hypothetical protein
VGESLRVFEGTRRLPNLNVGLEGIDVVADKGHVANGDVICLRFAKLYAAQEKKRKRERTIHPHTYIQRFRFRGLSHRLMLMRTTTPTILLFINPNIYIINFFFFLFLNHKKYYLFKREFLLTVCSQY